MKLQLNNKRNRIRAEDFGGESSLKYTTEEALAEIMRRREVIEFRKERRECRILSAAVGTLFALLIMVTAVLPGKPEYVSAGSVYGAFLLGQEAGGYVLTAVIAFVLGVTVTLLCIKFKNLRNGRGETDCDQR